MNNNIERKLFGQRSRENTHRRASTAVNEPGGSWVVNNSRIFISLLVLCALALVGATGGRISWTQLLSTDRHGTGVKGQSSDGTGTSGNVAKFDSGGNVSDGGVAASTLIGLGSLSGTSPIIYNSGTGAISCPTCGTGTGNVSAIATGTATLGTSAISSGACATVVTVSATGTVSTDTISFAPNASIKAVTGYAPVSTGGLAITHYPTANNVNFDVCNWGSISITPGAVTLNWMVVR